MKPTKSLLALALLASATTTGTAQASLFDRGNGLIYDNVNNITWAADANLFATQAASNANLVNDIIAANNGVVHDIPNIYNDYTGTYNLTSADFNTITGTMTWFGAQAWANSLTLGGLSGWKLPSTPIEIVGTNITSSQMGELFYNQLGGVSGSDIVTTHNLNYNLFTNIQNYAYWSSNEYNPNPVYAWDFVTYNGNQGINGKKVQFSTWAVRPGDVAAVPVPAAFWLFGSGLVSLIGFKRSGNIG